MQFHLWALSYFLFGDNDTAARIPDAVMGVAAVALTCGPAALARPHRLAGGRGPDADLPLHALLLPLHAEDPFVIPEALLMFWAIFSYFDTRKPKLAVPAGGLAGAALRHQGDRLHLRRPAAAVPGGLPGGRTAPAALGAAIAAVGFLAGVAPRCWASA